MSTNIVQVDGQKIKEIVESKGLSLLQASRKMGAGDSFLSGVVQNGRVNPAYLNLFCLTFDVDETDLISTPSRVFNGSRNFVPIDSDKCRKLVYKNGFTLNEVCDKLGYENSWLSNTLARGTMHENTLKRFADLMGVSWQSLKKDEPIIESKVSAAPIPNDIDTAFLESVYNLATSIEAALTNFRQDLLAIKSSGEGASK